jgi:hypothetical protein
MKSSLSPAAQAILDAYGDFEAADTDTMAAALRAVAEHCVPDDSEGHWVYIPHVLAIADELDGVS